LFDIDGRFTATRVSRYPRFNITAADPCRIGGHGRTRDCS
jgi:hypothetical protein